MINRFQHVTLYHLATAEKEWIVTDAPCASVSAVALLAALIVNSH